MSRIDLSTWAGGEGNGYIVEETSSAIVQRVLQMSAIESLARKENMNTVTKLVPRLYAEGPNVYGEGETINEAGAYLDSITLEAKKWASILHISEEDLNDSFVDVLNRYKTEWATEWAKKFDNACLGVDAAVNGTTVPYPSVYKKLANQGGTIIQNSTVTFADLNNTLAAVETKSFYDPTKMVVIAHPSFASSLRGLVDNNNRPILQEPLAGTTPTLFGMPVKYSFGAQRTQQASANTTEGNPLLFVLNSDMLINGVRAGIETAVSRDAKFDTDGVLLKIRARRAFRCADADGVAIFEKIQA